jgi:hypothetical protein
MKEFSLPLTRHLANGLRPDDRTARNQRFLVQCQNIRLTKIGEETTPTTFTPITSPFADGYLAGLTPSITVSFPFPQIFKGSEVTLLADVEHLYYATEGTNWTIAAAVTRDGYATTSAKTISAGSSWHFADFGRSWALFNGVSTVFKTDMYKMFLADDGRL